MAFCNIYLRCALTLLVAITSAQGVRAAEGNKGQSARDAREAAIAQIPWRSLTGPRKQAVSRVVTDASLFRRLPTRVIDCDPEVFDHLVDHPEMVVETWRLMGISKVGLRRTGPETFAATDAAGGRGSVQVLNQQCTADGATHVLAYAKGVYQAPPMPSPITATTVLNMRAQKRLAANGRTHITADLDAFIRLDRAGAELVLRTLQPLVNRTADHNFVETMKFVSLFSHTAERNPEGMVRMAGRMERIDEPTRREFAAICHRTAERSQSRRDQRLRLASAEAVRATR